jgi:predicted alpha-1,2-mannosidase
MLTYVDFTGKYTHAYVEGSAWQWRWGVPGDAEALVSLFRSREYFVEQLEQFFEGSPAGVGVNPNAYYWHGNQPDIYAAYLFNTAGRPDLTQKWVRWILETKYGDQENGLDGNDDGGTLSAWYVLSSLGLFPTAGTDRYEIGSPVWSRGVIWLDQQQSLTILADNASTENRYVQRVWLNEVELNRYWLSHAEIANGGRLRFEMGPQARVGR